MRMCHIQWLAGALDVSIHASSSQGFRHQFTAFGGMEDLVGPGEGRNIDRVRSSGTSCCCATHSSDFLLTPIANVSLRNLLKNKEDRPSIFLMLSLPHSVKVIKVIKFTASVMCSCEVASRTELHLKILLFIYLREFWVQTSALLLLVKKRIALMWLGTGLSRSSQQGQYSWMHTQEKPLKKQLDIIHMKKLYNLLDSKSGCQTLAVFVRPWQAVPHQQFTPMRWDVYCFSTPFDW